MTEEGLMIRELAQAAGVSVRTIRYYIAEGLLPAPTSGGRYARYTEDTLLRLRLIQKLKEAFLPLSEIRRRVSGLSVNEIAAALLEIEKAEAAPFPLEIAPGMEENPDEGRFDLLGARSPSISAPPITDNKDIINYEAPPRSADLYNPEQDRLIPPEALTRRSAPDDPQSRLMPQNADQQRRSEELNSAREYIRRLRESSPGDYEERRFSQKPIFNRLPSNLNRPLMKPSFESWRRIRISDEVEVHLREPLAPSVEKRLEALLAQIAQLLKSS